MEAVPAERLLPFWRQYAARFAPGEARFEPPTGWIPNRPPRRRDPDYGWETAPGELHAIGLDARGYLVLPAIAAEAGAVHRQTWIWLDPALRRPWCGWKSTPTCRWPGAMKLPCWQRSQPRWSGSSARAWG